MRIYTVHTNPALAGAPLAQRPDGRVPDGRAPDDRVIDDPVFVKEGFAWAAFLFPPFWLIYHRLWVALIGLLLVLGAVQTLGDALGASAQTTQMISLFVQLLLGFEANDLRRLKLEANGYQLQTIVAGRNLEEAEIRYFRSRNDHRASTSPPSLNQGPNQSPNQGPPSGAPALVKPKWAVWPKKTAKPAPAHSAPGEEEVLGLFPKPGT